MRTAIDTNVFSALWSSEVSVPMLLQRLGSAKSDGALIVCPAVFAELCAYPGATSVFVSSLLKNAGVIVDYELEANVWTIAGERYAAYAERRRKALHESPRRLMTDFLIGAHALLQAERLLTLDQAVYMRNFPDLSLL